MPIDAELKAAIDGLSAEQKSAIAGLMAKYDALQAKANQMQTQLDAVDARGQHRHITDGGNQFEMKAVLDKITENAGFQQLKESGRGRAIIQVPNLLEVKTITSSSVTGVTTANGLPMAYDPGIGDTGRKLYGRVRQLLRSIPITTGAAAFIKETAFTDAASPQASEGGEKNESNITFEGATAPVATVATWAGISKQCLDDSAEMGEFLNSSLLYGLQREFEEQLLDGAGTGGTLTGLSNGATAFDASLLNLIASNGWNYADVLRAAVLQLAEAGYGCTGFVVSPRDWFVIETMKDANRNYTVGDPRGALGESLWTRPVVPSPAMATGTFLAGDFETGAHIRMRMDAVIDISDSHSDYFTRNLLAVRAELRAALVIKKPAAFITGSFSQSPA